MKEISFRLIYFVTDECLGGAGPILFELTMFPKIHHHEYHICPLFFSFHSAFLLRSLLSNAASIVLFSTVYFHTVRDSLVRNIYIYINQQVRVCSSRNGPASVPRACSVFHFHFFIQIKFTNKIRRAHVFKKKKQNPH